jgi:hypothetical protein
LAFLDVSAILERITRHRPDHLQQVRHELELMERASKSEAYIVSLETSRSFRLTRPLRRVKASVLRKRLR